jgi:hypothetical protein
LLKHTHGARPTLRWPRGPPRQPTQGSPRTGSASLEALPHAHARSRMGVRAFNALTTAWRCHHAPGTHAPTLLHQLPRGNPSPPLWGTVRHGRCQPRDAAPLALVRLTCQALEGGLAAPSKRFPVTLQGQVVMLGRRSAIPATVELQPAAPVHTKPHRALWQQLRRCEACGNGTPPRLPLYSVQIVVSNLFEPIWRHQSQPLRPYPRSYHCSGTRYAMMARSRQGPSRRPPTLRRCTPYFPM